jgi:hypothetical protein
VVAELVQRHRGSVHLRSSQKVGASGTVFSIFLPEGATDSQPDLLGEAGMTSSASSSGEPEDLPGVRQLDDRAVTT